MLFRMLVDGLGGLHDTWSTMIMFIAVLSILVGNFVAIAQTNIKRMLGYSTISHVGFILLAVYTGTAGGYAAALVLHADLRCGGSRCIRHSHPAQPARLRCRAPERLQGPECAQPVVCLDDAVPDVLDGRRAAVRGLLSKLYVISAVLEFGGTGLAVLMVLASVVGAYYYLRVIWYMYFERAKTRPSCRQAPKRAWC